MTNFTTPSLAILASNRSLDANSNTTKDTGKEVFVPALAYVVSESINNPDIREMERMEAIRDNKAAMAKGIYPRTRDLRNMDD